ncbi:hypothetical protein ES703_117581 [subsurface metagenome]
MDLRQTGFLTRKALNSLLETSVSEIKNAGTGTGCGSRGCIVFSSKFPWINVPAGTDLKLKPEIRYCRESIPPPPGSDSE